jgi:hypothetical protein
MFPKSKAAKQAAIQDMLNLMFQYQGQQPMNKRMLGKVMRDLEAGGLEKLFGDISVDESQINRENQQLSQGIALLINAFDDNAAHIEGHTEFQKGPTYAKLGPQIGQVFEAHVREHRLQLQAAMGPMVQQPGAPANMAQPQAGSGGAPPAPTPTGGTQ